MGRLFQRMSSLKRLLCTLTPKSLGIERHSHITLGIMWVSPTLYPRNIVLLREFVWVDGCVTDPVAWASGPGTLASRGPWGRRCRGTRGPARSRERPWVCRSVHRPAKTASRRNHRSHAECALWSSLTRKMRFSVTSPVQSAPFGHVAVASPAQSALFREVVVADCAFT